MIFKIKHLLTSRSTQTHLLHGCLLLTLVATMGVAMPSCPGQQATQDRLATLEAMNTDLSKKLQDLTVQVHSTGTDMGQVKQLLPQMTSVIQAQKAAVDELNLKIKNLETITQQANTKKQKKTTSAARNRSNKKPLKK